MVTKSLFSKHKKGQLRHRQQHIFYAEWPLTTQGYTRIDDDNNIETHLIIVWEYPLLYSINRPKEWPDIVDKRKSDENCFRFQRIKLKYERKNLERGFLKMRGIILLWMKSRAGERGRRGPSNGVTAGAIALACIVSYSVPIPWEWGLAGISSSTILWETQCFQCFLHSSQFESVMCLEPDRPLQWHCTTWRHEKPLRPGNWDFHNSLRCLPMEVPDSR